jgi:hypothetical protein
LSSAFEKELGRRRENFATGAMFVEAAREAASGESLGLFYGWVSLALGGGAEGVIIGSAGPMAN